MPVTAAPPGHDTVPHLPLDPRIRERRIAVRREEGRRRLKFVSLVLAAGLLAGGALGIAHSPLLTVHHVRVAGALHTSQRDVVAASGVRAGTLMIEVSPGRMDARLRTLPWVATATVSRHWPNTVTIRVSERSALAILPTASGEFALVDETGRVLAVGPAGSLPSMAGPAPSPPLPVLRGLAPAGPAGSTVDPSGPGRGALELVAAARRDLPAALAARVSGVTLDGDGQLTATVSPAIAVRFGPDDQIDAKLLSLRTLLEAADLTGATVIDVRVPDAPVLTRQGRGTTLSTTPRG